MVSDKKEAPCIPFTEAIAVERLDSHTYKVHLNEAFCIGTGRTHYTSAPPPLLTTNDLLSNL